MDLNPATSAPQEKWFGLVVRGNESVSGSERPLPPQYGIFGIDRANPENMIPLGPDSGLPPHQLAAIEKFTECIKVLQGAGLSVCCPCQLKETNGANEPISFVVPGEERAVNTERRVSVSDETAPMPSVRSRPLADPVASVAVQGASGGSTASVDRSVQIAEDLIFARQLHEQLNFRQQPSSRAGKTEVSISQVTQSGCSSSSPANQTAVVLPPGVWSTGHYYF